MTAVSHGRPGVIERLWGSAYLLLSLTVLFWAGNSIAGRAANGVVPPMALSFWRWFIALLIVLPLARPHLRRDWPELKRRWKIVLALGLTGVSWFGAIMYWGLQYTTALNSVLVQAAIPPMIFLAAFVFLRERASGRQLGGVALSLLGVLVIITQGQPWRLAHVGLNIGDVAILLGVCLYAIYSVLLRRRPDVHPLSLLACTFAVAAAALLPFYVGEMLSGRFMRVEPAAFVDIGYVAILPSVVGYLFFNRGVELVGPGPRGPVHPPDAGVRRGAGRPPAARTALPVPPLGHRADRSRDRPGLPAPRAAGRGGRH
ncbi:MAG: DMT family transporter [Caulobacteraceae bacterium]